PADRQLHRAAGGAGAASRRAGRRHRGQLLHRRHPLREGRAVDARQRHGQRAAARWRHPRLLRGGRRRRLRRPLLRVRRAGGAGRRPASAGRRRCRTGARRMSWLGLVLLLLCAWLAYKLVGALLKLLMFALALVGAYWFLAPYLGWP